MTAIEVNVQVSNAGYQIKNENGGHSTNNWAQIAKMEPNFNNVSYQNMRESFQNSQQELDKIRMAQIQKMNPAAAAAHFYQNQILTSFQNGQ